MVIDVVIVLYNPKDEFFNKFKEMSSHFHQLFFIDNSTNKELNNKDKLAEIKNATYISLEGNQGIAKALNTGVDAAKKENPDYILTMDQDSIFPLDRMDDVTKILKENIDSKYGIIGLNFNSEETSLEIREVPWWITSGNFINARALVNANIRFMDELFIDGVDQEFCHSFMKAGYKIGLIPGLSLKHQIGNPKVHRILWKKFSTFNYPYFRYYYLFRNYYYLYKTDKKFYKKEFRKVKYFQPFKIRMYEENKKGKLRAAKLGKKDGKQGLLGPCQHEF